MKMAKKLLALALAGVLALSVLTSCGDKDSATEKNIADAMNSMLAGMGMSSYGSFSAGGSATKQKAQKGADYLSKVEISDFTTFDSGNSQNQEKVLMENTAKAMGYCSTDNTDTEYVWATCFEKESKLNAVAQATRIIGGGNVFETDAINKDNVKSNSESVKERKISFADFTGKDGKQYRLVVIIAKAVDKAPVSSQALTAA